MSEHQQLGQDSVTKATTAPDEDDPGKIDNPTELTKPSWTFTLKNAFRQFTKDQCTDLAAALTYFTVLALFPGLLAVISILGLVGEKERTTPVLLDLMGQIAPGTAADNLRPIIENMTGATGSGIMLIVGILVAIWSASGYVGAFGRAMNRVYQVDEGRPVWKLRPQMLLVTLIVVVMAALVLLMLALSGSVAQAVGNAIGLESTTVTVWNIVKWPIVLLVVIAIVALLYYATPNVQQPKFRWLSIGSAVAILLWLLASLAFGFYVGNFGNYNKTYGALGGVIVFLLWVWITNNALLFGAELDSELERARQLQSGIAAEEVLQLPPRDTTASDKAAEKAEQALAEARAIREDAEAHGARPEGAEGAAGQSGGATAYDPDEDGVTSRGDREPRDGVDGADYHPGERSTD